MKAIVALSLLLSVHAMAAEESTEGPGNGLQIDLDALSFQGLLNLATTTAPGTGGALAVSGGSAVAVGYHFDQNSILLDMAFGATSGTNVFFGMSPSYRRYWTPMAKATVTPFAEGFLTFGIFAPSGASSSFAFGMGGDVGAEYLFAKNMGIEGLASLSYMHTNNGANFNVDLIGVSGKIGLTVHF